MKTIIVGLLVTLGLTVVANFLFGSVIAGAVCVGGLFGLIRSVCSEVNP